jgi:hypothetical protein
LIKERAAKNNLKLDGHEADFNFLKKSLTTFDTLCQLFPKDFKAIECTKNGEMLSIPQISDLIWKRVKPLLPSEKSHPSHSVVVSLTHDSGGQESNEGSASELVHVFKNASLLLRLLLQRNLQVKTYPDFRTWSDNGYSFYTPQGMAKNLASNYKATFERYAELNQQLQQKIGQYMERHILTDENLLHQSLAKLILPLTPLGALTSFKARIDKKSVRHVCAQLLSNDSQEVQWAAKQLYVAARQKWPDYFSEPLESSDGPVAVNNILAKLVDERLPHNITSGTPVKLLEAHPRLEFDLLAESIYPHTSLSLEEIREEVSNWPYQQKFQSFQQAATNDEILHKVRYKLDIISNQITINNFIEAGRLKDTQVQAFTPRYGFEVPQIIEEAGIDDTYNEVFDESVRLYSLLQAGDCAEQAAYATLLGHKARWQITADGKSLAEIIKNARSNDAVIVKDVNELVAEVHPLLWEILSGHGPSNQTIQKNGKSRVKPYHQRTAKKKKKQS